MIIVTVFQLCHLFEILKLYTISIYIYTRICSILIETIYVLMLNKYRHVEIEFSCYSLDVLFGLTSN